MVDGIFGSQQYVTAKKLLDVTALRQAAIASNIANVETPGYKRIDVSSSFEAKLQQAASAGDIKAIRSLNAEIVQDPTASALRADGNNVSLDREMMQMQRTGVEYEFLTQYLSSNLNRIKSAISTTPGM